MFYLFACLVAFTAYFIAVRAASRAKMAFLFVATLAPLVLTALAILLVDEPPAVRFIIHAL
jgi:hypothetical protein